MFLFILILLNVTVATEKNDNCHNSASDFCEMIATDTDKYYIGCDDPSADLLPHPEYCTLYIQCIGERSSVTNCCPGYDSIGDGCIDLRMWFNPEKLICDFKENVDRSCSLPVANISTTTTTTTVGI